MRDLTDVNTGLGNPTLDIAAGIAGALKVDDLSHPPTTGAQAQAQIAQMRAHMIARYRLTNVTGKPEEMVSSADPNRGASLGYGCRTIRVRLMAGREWLRADDFQIRTDWHAALHAMCDTYFHYAGPDTTNRHITGTPPRVYADPKNEISDRFSPRP